MRALSTQTALPLPRGWRKITRAGVLHAISVAEMETSSSKARNRVGCGPETRWTPTRGADDALSDPAEPASASVRHETDAKGSRIASNLIIMRSASPPPSECTRILSRPGNGIANSQLFLLRSRAA